MRHACRACSTCRRSYGLLDRSLRILRSLLGFFILQTLCITLQVPEMFFLNGEQIKEKRQGL